MKEHKKKAFFKSRNPQVPSVTQKHMNQTFETTNQDVLYTNEYLVRRSIFYNAINEGGNPEQVMNFQESIVRYTKIKK